MARRNRHPSAASTTYSSPAVTGRGEAFGRFEDHRVVGGVAAVVHHAARRNTRVLREGAQGLSQRGVPSHELLEIGEGRPETERHYGRIVNGLIQQSAETRVLGIDLHDVD